MGMRYALEGTPNASDTIYWERNGISLKFLKSFTQFLLDRLRDRLSAAQHAGRCGANL